MLNKTNFLCLLFVCVFPPLVCGSSYAQSDSPAEEPPETLESLFDPAQGSGELRAVKEQIQALIKENKALEAELAPIKAEFLDVQGKVQRAQGEVSALEKEQIHRQKELERRMQVAGGSSTLQQLQIYDLQYQKKELELELRLRELAVRQKREAHDRLVAELKKELEQNTEEQEQLAAGVEELRKQNAPFLYEIELLRQENLGLENQLRSRKPLATAAALREIESSPPASGPTASLRQRIRQKQNEKALLEQKIKELETAPTYPSKMDFLSSDGSFAATIQRLEEENRLLKSRLFSLRENSPSQE